MKQSRGQSLPEYALMAGVLILGTLFALQFFSSNVVEKQGAMWSSFTGGQAGLTAQSGQMTNNQGDFITGDAQIQVALGNTTPEGQNQVGAQGSSVPLSNNAIDDALNWEEALENQSAGEYVNSLPAAMMKKADELQQQGILSGEEAGQIKQLASEGYRIAGAMATIEAALEANATLPDSQKLSIPVQFENKTYRLQELSEQLGFDDIGAKATSMDDFIHATDVGDGSLAQSFTRQYGQLQKSGILQSEEVGPVMNELSYRILYSGETVEHHLADWSISNGHTESYNVKDWVVGKMKENTASSSEVICSLGSGNSDGGSCQ